LATLVAISILTVLMSAAIAPGVAKVAASSEPLFLAFQTIFGAGITARTLALLACTGLIASFHTIIFAYGRQIYSLSRAGYFPTWLSVTHGRRKTPHRALITGAALGYLVALAIHLLPNGSPAGAVLLNMAVFGAVLAYVLQLASFLALRWKFAAMPRPYVSPAGVAGALVATAVALATLATLFRSADYNKGVWGAAAWFALGIAYYAFYARKRLVMAPEEKSAFLHRRENPPA
jgi:ethanolamine permease